MISAGVVIQGDIMAKKKASKATTKTASKPKGKFPNGRREPGSKNRNYDECRVVISQCKRCGSTERGKYRARVVKKLPANSPHRPQFTHEVRRSCACAVKECGQWRWDVTLENSEGWHGGEPELDS